MRTCIQLGLNTSADWAYLTQYDWVDYMRTVLDRPQHILPELFTEDSTPFKYYGIDIEPESIAHVANSDRYKDFTNVTWICAGISDTHYLIEPTSRYHGSEWYNFPIHNKMHVYITMKHLINQISPPTFDIFALDIDGYEHYIFNDMAEWPLLPTFITIELHSPAMIQEEKRKYVSKGEASDILIATIVENGYSYLDPIMKDETKKTIGIQEMRFLKTEFF